MIPTQIRLLKKTELWQVRQLAEIIFPITYKDIVSPEQIDYVLKLFYAQENLDEQFETGQIFLMAYNENIPSAYASYTCLNNSGEFKLNKIYIDPRAQGKGIGKSLLLEVIRRIKLSGGRSLQLNVMRKNPAINFYYKMGFTIKEEMMLDIGHGFFMDDYVMEKTL